MPAVVQTKTLVIAKIRAKVPTREIQERMGELIRELTEELQAQRISAVGPLFTHHFRPPDAYFDFEVCLPTNAPVSPRGRVEAGKWPAMQVVQAIHQGSYAGLVAAWGELMRWAAAQGIVTTNEAWERYLVGPETEADPEKWRTELNRPLA